MAFRYLSAVVLVVPLVACVQGEDDLRSTPETGVADAAPAAPADALVETDYEVYSAVVQWVLLDYPCWGTWKAVATLDQVGSWTSTEATSAAESLKGLQQETLDDYVRRDAHANRLERRLVVPITYHLLPFDTFKGFDQAAEDYPDASKFVMLSKIGYSPERGQALLHMVKGCGDLQSTGHLLLLEKQAGTWVIVAELQTFIS